MLRGEPIDRFFAYARDRERIRLQRAAGQPAPWTIDPILRSYRFCNIDREDDAVTTWFRTNVREPMRAMPEVMLATILFRWFNTPRVGAVLFKTRTRAAGLSPFGEYLRTRDPSVLDRAIRECLPEGPYVTGAYMIKTPAGMDKIAGVLWCVDQFNKVRGEYEAAFDDSTTLEGCSEALTMLPYMGDFMAYEVVTDLRHTDLLCNAPDIMTWANPGPGAARGLDRLALEPLGTRNRNRPADRAAMQIEMQVLLECSQEQARWPTNDYRYWPQGEVMRPFKPWEMRTVEHTLCEFDKYERVRLGEGRPKQLFRKGEAA